MLPTALGATARYKAFADHMMTGWLVFADHMTTGRLQGFCSLYDNGLLTRFCKPYDDGLVPRFLQTI